MIYSTLITRCSVLYTVDVPIMRPLCLVLYVSHVVHMMFTLLPDIWVFCVLFVNG